MKIAIILGFFAYFLHPSIGQVIDSVSSIPGVNSKKVIVIPIAREVDPGLSFYLKRAVKEAEKESPDIIIFSVNTFGGRLDAAFEIVDLITGIKFCSTYAYVHEKAISAGALISLACNRLAMGNHTTIGDCAPIIQSQEGIKMAGEKIESPLRAKFRNLAERNGYPNLLSQAMVSMDMQIIKVIKNGKQVYFTQGDWDDLSKREQGTYTGKSTIVRKGELLTMTDSEARDLEFSLGSFASIEDFIKSQNYTLLKKMESNWSEELVRAIGKIAPLLMLLGFGALYMEMKTPGFGVFGIVGIICLAIVFGSKYMSGLANHTEMLILLAGVALFIIEIYILPGTFIFGLMGLVLITVGLILSLQSFTIPNPEFPWQKQILMDNILLVLGMAVLSLFIPLLGIKYLLPHLPGNINLIPAATLKQSRVTSVVNTAELKPGLKGITLTILKPSGKGEFSGHRLEVTALSGYIDDQKEVEIVEIQGNKIIVKEVVS